MADIAAKLPMLCLLPEQHAEENRVQWTKWPATAAAAPDTKLTEKERDQTVPAAEVSSAAGRPAAVSISRAVGWAVGTAGLSPSPCLPSWRPWSGRRWRASCRRCGSRSPFPGGRGPRAGKTIPPPREADISGILPFTAQEAQNLTSRKGVVNGLGGTFRQFIDNARNLGNTVRFYFGKASESLGKRIENAI